MLTGFELQAFQRWRLYTKQSRNLVDDVPKAELERALRRSKAQVSTDLRTKRVELLAV